MAKTSSTGTANGDCVVCSIITKNHLAYARRLGQGLRQHSPSCRYLVLLADRLDGEFEVCDQPFELITLKDLPDQALIESMCFWYTPLELCCALRGHLHEYVLTRTQAQRWLFLDCDMEILGPVEPVFELLGDANIAFCAHLRPGPRSAEDWQAELEALQYGLYNGGLVALRRGSEAQRFAAWFKERLSHHCFKFYVPGIFLDQRWLDLVPRLFGGVKVVEHPGINVGFWNLNPDALAKGSDGSWTVDGHPLILFHFSGLEMPQPKRLSRWQRDGEVLQHPLVVELAERYRQGLVAQGYLESAAFPYAFSCLDDGREISLELRRSFHQLWHRGRRFSHSPFDHRHWQPREAPTGQQLSAMR